MKETLRPWGKFCVLLDDDNCKVKKITVNPGQALSYQYHHKRSEDWVFTEGTGVVTINDKQINVSAGEKVHIPVLSKHCNRNDSDKTLEFIEVQTGEYFGEDDIVRINDIYGRC